MKTQVGAHKRDLRFMGIHLLKVHKQFLNIIAHDMFPCHFSLNTYYNKKLSEAMESILFFIHVVYHNVT